MQIDKGRFGDVPLDGLRWGFVATWRGPIHAHLAHVHWTTHGVVR